MAIVKIFGIRVATKARVVRGRKQAPSLDGGSSGWNRKGEGLSKGGGGKKEALVGTV